MYLLWVESTMCDLIVLMEGDEEMRQRYNAAYGEAPHPPEFIIERMKMTVHSFGKIREKFFKIWPRWENCPIIGEAVERVVIYRNAFGHAQVQPHRGYLLYSPANWDAINKYCYCGNCSKRHSDCDCPKVNSFEPRCLKLDLRTVCRTYDDIKTIDQDCFCPTAVDMGIQYRGIAWPTGNGGFLIAENSINMSP